MLVSKIIQHLQEYHEPDEHLMIDWLEADSLNGDDRMTEELWIRSCQLQEQATESIIDRDYAAGFVYDAERKIRAEDMKESLALMDDYRDVGMSPKDFLSEL
jgi:hypothetical protein